MDWTLIATVGGSAVAGYVWTYVTREWRISSFLSMLLAPVVAAVAVLACLVLLRSLHWIASLGFDGGRRGPIAGVAVPVLMTAAIPALVGALVARIRQRRSRR